MASFKTTFRRFEYGDGWHEFVFVVADSYAGLFDHASAIETGVFRVEKTSEAYDKKVAVFKEDELSFELSALNIKASSDLRAFSFVLSAQAVNTKRYCGFFVDGSTIDEHIFLGVVRPQMQASDLSWKGNSFDTLTDPVRTWKCKAQNLGVNILDVPLMDIASDISPTIKALHASDRLGYYKSGATEVRFSQLINLNIVLKEFLIYVADSLDFDYTIELLESTLDFKLSPARFEDATPDSLGRISTERGPAYFKIKEDDAHVVKIGTENDGESIFISYEMINPLQANKDYTFLQMDKFSDLLYELAREFGMYLQFTQEEDVLKVKFLPRTDITKWRTYIPTATGADISIQPVQSKNEKSYVGYAWPYSLEGSDYYLRPDVNSSPTHSFRVKNLQSGSSQFDRMLLTAAPTHVLVDAGGVELPYGRAAHNTVISTDSAPEKNFAGLHTSMYLKTIGKAESTGTEGLDVWLPAGKVHAKMYDEKSAADVQKDYNAFADYTNEVLARDGEYYDGEYKVEVPFFNSFSKFADGSEKSWKNVQCGCEWFHQENQYSELLETEVTVEKRWLIVGLDRNPDKMETTLRVQLYSRYAYSEPTGAMIDEDGVTEYASSTQTTTVKKTLTDSFYESTFVAVRGEIVVIGEDKKLYRAIANSSQYSLKIGIVLAFYGADFMTEVQLVGRHENTGYALEPGKKVYVRTGEPFNFSQTHLPDKDGAEDMYVCFGHADSETSIVLGDIDKWIYP